MYDVLLQQLPKAEKTPILEQLDLKQKNYALLTTHRPENVDNLKNLKNITEAVIKLKQLTIVFPAHPRTQKQLRKFRLYNTLKKQKHIKLTKPTGYHETIKLIKNATIILTDSGGMQKEAFWLKTPCITLRKNTEWTETVQLEANYLTGTNPQKITKTARKIIKNEEEIRKRLEEVPNPFGDGKASQKILETIKSYQTELS